MSKIYTINDKIPVKIGDIIFYISPLKYSQKCELQSYMTKAIEDNNMQLAQDAAFKAIQYSVKDVKGLTHMDGSEFRVDIEEGILSEESVDNLLNIEHSTKLAALCTSLINGIANKIIDPYTGKTMEGISFEVTEKKN